MKKLRGTGVALVTPFNSDLSIDYIALEKLINYQIASNINYIVLMGTTGESVVLSNDEKRDIVRLIEEGRNLPEKFKYLLFEDSRKVEVNWENKKQDLTNISLPFQIIEQVDEPRSEKIKQLQGSFDFATGASIFEIFFA